VLLVGKGLIDEREKIGIITLIASLVVMGRLARFGGCPWPPASKYAATPAAQYSRRLAQLAYEGERGPELAHRFERFGKQA
jgi:hypothetical protein